MIKNSVCLTSCPSPHLHMQGVDMPLYVIIIHMLPFLPNPFVHKDTLQLAPLYQNEEGKCYIRNTNSLKLVSTCMQFEMLSVDNVCIHIICTQMSYQDVADFTRWQASEHFEKLLRR